MGEEGVTDTKFGSSAEVFHSEAVGAGLALGVRFVMGHFSVEICWLDLGGESCGRVQISNY